MKRYTLVLLAGAVVALVGCAEDQGSGNPNQAPPTQASIDEEIKKIDADPNMPEQAKAMRKATLLRGGTGQKTMSK
jgi:hypothetical protein